jgi:predicted PurR-regulated permease PerM
MAADRENKGLTLQLIALPILVAAAGTAFLYFAAPILIPIVIAASLTYLLLPLVDFVKKLKVPHWLAVLIVSFVFLALFSLIAFFLIAQLADLLSNLPQYRDRILSALESLDPAISKYLGDIGSLLKAPESIFSDAGKVQSIGRFLLKGVSSVTNFILGATVIFFLVLFMLLESNLFSNKLRRIFGSDHESETEKILNEINKQFKGYVLTRFYDFIGLSLVVTIFLLIMDVDYAYVWGPLAGVFNLIPYLGPFLGAIPPIIMAGIQHNSFMIMVYLAIFFLVLQMIEGNYIMPKITTASVDLNAVTVLVSLIYWGWIWGGIGLILSVPITAAIKVVCDHVEPLKPIGLLLGTDRGDEKEEAPEKVPSGNL